MTDSHDDALVPDAPKKNKGGRPRKAPDLSQVVKDLQDQIAAMQRAQIANIASNADRFEKVQQQATLAPIPSATEDLPPGSYVTVGVDASGAPIRNKVHWTKELIAQRYPAVTFTPNVEMTVGPHGVLYRMNAGIETTVPSIVKSIYDETIKKDSVKIVEGQDANRPWTPAEHADLSARAAETPGVGVRSRLARVGGGLNVHTAENTNTPETPAQ